MAIHPAAHSQTEITVPKNELTEVLSSYALPDGGTIRIVRLNEQTQLLGPDNAVIALFAPRERIQQVLFNTDRTSLLLHVSWLRLTEPRIRAFKHSRLVLVWRKTPTKWKAESHFQYDHPPMTILHRSFDSIAWLSKSGRFASTVLCEATNENGPYVFRNKSIIIDFASDGFTSPASKDTEFVER